MTGRPDDPRIDPARRCMPLDEWPEADRRAWLAAAAPGDPLEPGGAAAGWARRTRACSVSSYGRWLTFLAARGGLDRSAPPADRLTAEAVAAYAAELQRLNTLSTATMRVHQLARAVAAMVPGTDLGAVWRMHRRLKREGEWADVRSRREPPIPAPSLAALGLRLMAEADSTDHGAASRRALRYRDGFMIALLAARPLRLRNFAAVELGRHLRRSGTGYLLVFGAGETKTRAPLELPFPADLVPALERYLGHHRRELLRRAGSGRWSSARGVAGDRLWVSSDGSAMSETGIYDRIVRATSEGLGRRTNPHAFRAAAATSVALLDPEHLHINRCILGHATIETSERHYNRAGAAAMPAAYQALVMDLRRGRGADGEGPPRRRAGAGAGRGR